MDVVAEELYDLLQKEAQKKTLFVVEGEKDKRALTLLGVDYVITLQTKPLYQIIEEISEVTRTVVILTDLDQEGKKLYGKLHSGLAQRGVYVDNAIRHFIFKNTTLQQIEGLDTYLQKRLPQLL